MSQEPRLTTGLPRFSANAISDSVPSPPGNATSARIKAALGDISSYESALELYALDNNDQYPSSLNQLVSGKKKYLRDLNTDPWGNPYIYEKPGRKHPESFDLYSSGADGQKGTGDDVAPWLNNEQ